MKRSIIAFGVTSTLVLSTLGCAGLRTRSDLKSEQPKSAEIVAPGSSLDAPSAAEDELRVSEAPRPVKWGLILGPGGMKTLAHVGVLKILSRERAPIVAVVGLEWGAVIGAVFAQRGEVNELEWRLYKWEQRGWPKRTWLKAEPSALSPEEHAAVLADLLKGFSFVGPAPLAFSCPSRDVVTGALHWQAGALTLASLAECSQLPPLVTPTSKGAMAAIGEIEEAARQLRRLGADRVVYVDVLSGALVDVADRGEEWERNFVKLLWRIAGAGAAKPTLPGVDHWIQVPTAGISIFGLSARKALSDQGEASAKAFLKAAQD